MPSLLRGSRILSCIATECVRGRLSRNNYGTNNVRLSRFLEFISARDFFNVSTNFCLSIQTVLVRLKSKNFEQRNDVFALILGWILTYPRFITTDQWVVGWSNELLVIPCQLLDAMFGELNLQLKWGLDVNPDPGGRPRSAQGTAILSRWLTTASQCYYSCTTLDGVEIKYQTQLPHLNLNWLSWLLTLVNATSNSSTIYHCADIDFLPSLRDFIAGSKSL